VYDQIVIKIMKRKRDGYQTSFALISIYKMIY